MTKDEYKSALKSLGMKQQELMNILGLSKDAPRRWVNKVPKYVSAYLELRTERSRLREMLRKMSEG